MEVMQCRIKSYFDVHPGLGPKENKLRWRGWWVPSVDPDAIQRQLSPVTLPGDNQIGAISTRLRSTSRLLVHLLRLST